jgi:glycine betaine/proline transport system substrate-binding protein
MGSATLIRALAVGLIISSASMPAVADDLPGKGKTVKMARPTWDTAYLGSEIYKSALTELGYDVAPFVTLDNPIFYQSVGQGDVDLWTDGSFPSLHETYRSAFEPGAEVVGTVSKGATLQGYLVDKKTAEQYKITNLADFKKDEIKKLFDIDGDGKADMVACQPGWGCEKSIDRHLKLFGLSDDITPIKSAYNAAMADVLGRYKDGKPVFFYTWTPNWTVGLLKPGTDVVWLEAPETGADNPDHVNDNVMSKGIKGCLKDPCRLGFPADDINSVANKKFLAENPAVKKLLEELTIPGQDLLDQNAKMYAGENKEADIQRHAKEWIAAHQDQWNKWIADAKAAAK